MNSVIWFGRNRFFFLLFPLWMCLNYVIWEIIFHPMANIQDEKKNENPKGICVTWSHLVVPSVVFGATLVAFWLLIDVKELQIDFGYWITLSDLLSARTTNVFWIFSLLRVCAIIEKKKTWMLVLFIYCVCVPCKLCSRYRKLIWRNCVLAVKYIYHLLPTTTTTLFFSGNPLKSPFCLRTNQQKRKEKELTLS